MTGDERDEWLAKAAGSFLSATEKRQWERLCHEHPELEQKAEELKTTAQALRRALDARETAARLQAPDAPPPWVLAQFETGRRQVFGIAPRPAGFRQRLSRWLSGGARLPPPLLAAAAAMVVLAAGWWAFQENGLPTSEADFKSAGISADLPVAAPGRQTRLTDPGLIWISLDQQPVEVEMLDADGRVLWTARTKAASLGWEDLTPATSESKLSPGHTYLARWRKGGIISEQPLTVLPDAQPLASWLKTADPVSLAESWLAEGQAADALLLATAAARLEGSNDTETRQRLAEVRRRALQAALESSAPSAAP